MSSTQSNGASLRSGAARFGLLAGLVLALASCTAPDRGNCLQSRTETRYHPASVFLGGNGYSHEWEPSEEKVCTLWEYPDGKPKG